jgi:hypothetical protein
MKVHVLARHGLTPPSRNGLSHANKERDAAFIEKKLIMKDGKVYKNTL